MTFDVSHRPSLSSIVTVEFIAIISTKPWWTVSFGHNSDRTTSGTRAFLNYSLFQEFGYLFINFLLNMGWGTVRRTINGTGVWWHRERSFGYVTTTELVWRQRKNGTVFSAQLSNFCDLIRRKPWCQQKLSQELVPTLCALWLTHPDSQMRLLPH